MIDDIKVIATPERIKRLKKCIGIIEGYGHFREGQDGFAALLEIRKFVDEMEGKLSPEMIKARLEKR